MPLQFTAPENQPLFPSTLYNIDYIKLYGEGNRNMQMCQLRLHLFMLTSFNNFHMKTMYDPDCHDRVSQYMGDLMEIFENWKRYNAMLGREREAKSRASVPVSSVQTSVPTVSSSSRVAGLRKFGPAR